MCGDISPHRTTMTQTKRCPIFKFGSWWCFHRQTPQESDCEINASFAQGCVCVINASRRCGVPATGCCGTGPCLYQSSVRITEHHGQAGQSLGPLWNQLPLGMGGDDQLASSTTRKASFSDVFLRCPILRQISSKARSLTSRLPVPRVRTKVAVIEQSLTE